MPKEIQIRCDCGCKQVRMQSNNWIQAQIDSNSFQSWKWDDKRANRKGVLFLAGEDCAHKLYSQWLASRVHKSQEVLGNEAQDEVQAEKAVGWQEGSSPAVD
jgi:hypothetical protein